MMLLVGWAVDRVFAIVPPLVSALQIGELTLSPLQKIVMSAGAGFHEELVFRVILFGGLAKLLHMATKRVGLSFLIAGVISALLFSAVHYIGDLRDSFELVSFVFRFLSGLYLALVFHYRGFAVAVYTHTIYDLLVMFWRG